MKIIVDVREYDDYFRSASDSLDSPVQKCTSALRCIAYNAPPDTE
jgi:hypothetical protein